MSSSATVHYRHWIHHSYRRHPILRKWVWPLIVHFLIALWGLAASLGHLEKWNESHPNAIFFAAFTTLVLTLILQVLLPYLERSYTEDTRLSEQDAIQRMKNAEMSMRDYSEVSSHVNGVIYSKSSRFSDVLKKLKHGSIKKEDVFFEITQPERQIKLLLEKIANYFVSGDDSVFPSICIFNVINDRAKSSDLAYPPDYRPSIKEFKSGHGVAGACLKEQCMILIPDIEEDISKPGATFLLADNTKGEPERGCICCYPIRNEDKIELILSIKLSQPNIITEENKGLAKRILIRPIADRILLEHRLMLLKQLTKEV